MRSLFNRDNFNGTTKEYVDSQFNNIANLQQAWIPNNYQKFKGICIDDALYSSEWILPDSSTGIQNVRRVTDKKLFESGSILFDLTPSGWKGFTKAISYDCTNRNIIAFALFIDDPYSFDSVEIRLTTDSSKANGYNNWTKYFKNTSGLNTSTRLHSGWNYIKLHKNDFTNIGTETWGIFKAVRFIFTIPTNKFDNLYTGATGSAIISTTVGIGGIYINPVYETPMYLVSFDDSSKSMFDNLFPYLRQNGVHATLFLCRNNVADIGGHTAYMDESEHDLWYQAGNDICCHSTTHSDMTTLSPPQIQDEFNVVRNYILSHGWVRGANICAMPMNRYNTICLQALKDIGFVFGRGRNYGTIDHITPSNILAIHTYEIKGTTLLSTITGNIDKAIERQSSMSTFTHNVVSANPDQYSITIADAKAWIDYLITKRDAGLIELVTYSQFYNKLSNKTISVPSIITT